MSFLDKVLTQKLQVMQKTPSSSNNDDNKSAWQRETDLKPDRYSEGSFTYTMEDGRTITVSETFEELGTRVWDTCTLFGKYFEHQRALGNLSFKDKKVIELGSGTGILGMLLLNGGFECKSVTLTEKDNLVKNLEKQIKQNEDPGLNNPNCELRTAALDWYKFKTSEVLAEPYDVLIGSDITVFPQTIPSLVGIMKHVLDKSEHAQIYIGSVTEREAFKPFLEAAEEAGISFEEIPKQDWHPNYKSTRISLVKFIK